MNTQLETALAAMQKAILAKQVVYHNPDDLGGEIGTNYYEPDPAYAPLLALVQEECPYEGTHKYFTVPCDLCQDGYILRTAYWQVAPNGALEGALLKCLRLLRASSAGILVNLLNLEGDTRIKALKLVLAWLRDETRP